VSTTETTTTTGTAASRPPMTATEKPIVVVDLGKRSKKKVKKLRKGTGPLMDRVVDTVDQLEADGEVEANHQIVVVVVRQEDDDRKGLLW
jgi:hypothetical protein